MFPSLIFTVVGVYIIALISVGFFGQGGPRGQPLREQWHQCSARTKRILLSCAMGYAVFSIVMVFAQDILPARSQADPSGVSAFFHSNWAYVLGPPLNLIWRAPLYVAFYCVGTWLIAINILGCVCETRIFVKVSWAVLSSVYWLVFGFNAYGPAV